jgi:hypothetical protein
VKTEQIAEIQKRRKWAAIDELAEAMKVVEAAIAETDAEDIHGLKGPSVPVNRKRLERRAAVRKWEADKAAREYRADGGKG